MKTSPPPRLPLFRSDLQARLLTEIYLSTNGGRSLADLSRATGASSGGVHKEVERLEQAGLVLSTRVGQTRLVTPNTESPYYTDLRSLLLKAFGPTPLLRRSLLPVAGIEEAFIFGSWARLEEGTLDRPPRDVDLMVIGQPDIDAVYEALRETEREIGRSIQLTVKTRQEWTDDRSGFANGVRVQPKVSLVEPRPTTPTT